MPPTAPLSLARLLPARPVLRRAAPSLSVVIVNYHTWEDTARLVRQLRRSDSFRSAAAEVMVVDNGSPPHPQRARLRRAEGVSLRCWGRNRGFARAVNEGVRLSRGDWLLLLNPDVSVADDFLDGVMTLADRLDRESPGVGIAGLGLRDADGRPQGSAGPFPTFGSTVLGLLRPRAWREYHRSPAAGPVDWVSGCGMMVRRRVLVELGGLDPAFFLYYEDVDLCRRARQAGWEVRHEPALALVHHRPLHGRPVPAGVRLLTRQSLLTYAARHWRPWQARWLARLVGLEAALRAWKARRAGEADARVFDRLGQVARSLGRGAGLQPAGR
jgi:GT2 family glycosyltransferase